MAAKSQSRRGVVAWSRGREGRIRSSGEHEGNGERERERAGMRWKERSEREMEKRGARNTEGRWLGGRRWSGITE